jgi:hypothetical protein
MELARGLELRQHVILLPVNMLLCIVSITLSCGLSDVHKIQIQDFGPLLIPTELRQHNCFYININSLL